MFKTKAGQKVSDQFRQGDVLIERVENLSGEELVAAHKEGRGLKPRIDPNGLGYVFAYGEVTGHSHRLSRPTAVLERPEEIVIPDAEKIDFYENSEGQIFLVVKDEEGVDVRHEEHETIHLAKGTYMANRQVEYGPTGDVQVLD